MPTACRSVLRSAHASGTTATWSDGPMTMNSTPITAKLPCWTIFSPWLQAAHRSRRATQAGESGLPACFSSAYEAGQGPHGGRISRIMSSAIFFACLQFDCVSFDRGNIPYPTIPFLIPKARQHLVPQGELRHLRCSSLLTWLLHRNLYWGRLNAVGHDIEIACTCFGVR